MLDTQKLDPFYLTRWMSFATVDNDAGEPPSFEAFGVSTASFSAPSSEALSSSLIRGPAREWDTGTPCLLTMRRRMADEISEARAAAGA